MSSWPSGSRGCCSRSCGSSGLSGIVVGILNAYDQFTIPSLTPVAWNLVIILGLVVGVPLSDEINTQLYIYAGVDPVRHARPVPDAAAISPRARRPDPPGHRLARPCGQAVLRPDAPRHGDARPHQRQRGDLDVLRVPVHRPGAGAAGDQQGVPALHAPAGDLLGRGRDRPLPDAVAPRCPERDPGIPKDGRRGHSADRVPARFRRACSRLRLPFPSPVSSTSTASSRPPTRRSSRSAWQRSRSGSCSTGGC